MGYVIIKKGKRTIKIPGFLYRLKCILDKDFEFDYIKNVSEICYSGIDFNDIYFSFYKKKVIFDNCKFSDCELNLNDSILISNSEFMNSELRVSGKKKFTCVELIISEKDASSEFYITADRIRISGSNISDNKYYLVGSQVDVVDTDIGCEWFKVNNSGLINVKSSSVIATGDIVLNYEKLYLDNVHFESEDSSIMFCDDNLQKTAFYFKNVENSATIITDSILSNKKNESIYSLLSILMGYRNEICKINKEELNRQKEKIDLEVSQKLDEIDSQIEALRKKQNNINNSVLEQKLLLDDKYNRRKVRSIGVRK